MSLANKILGQLPDNMDSGSDGYYDGFAEASGKAANAVTEADGLMQEMADLIDKMADVFESELELGYEVECRVINTKYYDWKERAK